MLTLARLAFVHLLVLVIPVKAADAATDIVAALKAKGAEFTETKGVVTGVSFRDCTKFTAEDFARLKQLPQLKQVSLGLGCNDATFAALGDLPDLENLGTNGFSGTDEGVRTLTRFKKLKSLSFFHPGKDFTGATLPALAELPGFESLTVGGSMKFNDKSMESVAQLKGLKGFRTWHTGVTHIGAAQLTALPKLANLTLGHDLNPKLPAELTDDSLPMLARLASLESLALMEAKLSVAALANLKALAKLKRLTLDSCIFSDGELAALKQELPKVDVRWNPPTDAIKQRIEALAKPATK